MDRFFAMLILLGSLVSLLLVFLAIFAQAPIISSCIFALFYALYVFLANESMGIHHAQEYENRFWTAFAALFSAAAFFAKDSPLRFGLAHPFLGIAGVFVCGYGMHTWDRHVHRKDLSRRFSSSLRLGVNHCSVSSLSTLSVGGKSISKANLTMTNLIAKINSLLADIDQNFIPSTVNNFINTRFILKTEREIINIFEEAEPAALNYLIGHTKLGLLFYKVKDHRRFNHRHRTQLIELLAVDRVSHLTIQSKVCVLHSLQMMKLPANTKAEHWVRNIILSAKQDQLSDLKSLADARGNWYCMAKLIYDDIRSDVVRRDILNHIQREAKVQQAHLKMRTKRSRQLQNKGHAWRKILSDVDDTLTCSGGSYPAGIDRRWGKKVVYPGVLAFYRELDLGWREGEEEWDQSKVGNLVFLSARPHIYKDVTEKKNFSKFKKLQQRSHTTTAATSALSAVVNGTESSISKSTTATATTSLGNSNTATNINNNNLSKQRRGGMHTAPTLLAGCLSSGTEFLIKNDYEPLALKKFENFKKYVSIYPEYQHVFVCDNGQGDVRASELMVDNYPNQVEAIYVHVVQDVNKTYKYNREQWREQQSKCGTEPFFFHTYPEAALDAATRKPQPLISLSGLSRICQDAVNDFYMIQTKDWPSSKHKLDRREELNQSLWKCNLHLIQSGREPVRLIEIERLWKDGDTVSTPYGRGTILGFDPIFDLYEVDLDWRPLCVQVEEEAKRSSLEEERKKMKENTTQTTTNTKSQLETVFETVEEVDEDPVESLQHHDHPVSPVAGNRSKIKDDTTGENSLNALSLKEEEEDKNKTRLLEMEEPTGDVEQHYGILEKSEKKRLDLNDNYDTTNTSSLPKNTTEGDVTVETKSIKSNNLSCDTVTEQEEEEKKKTKESEQNPHENNNLVFHPVVAKVQGRLICEFIPPKLPKFSDESNASTTTGFSFWSSSSSKNKSTPKFKKGDGCNTPYGLGTVSEYREEEEIVVVVFSNWSASAYLHQNVVKICNGSSGGGEKGFLGTLLRKITTSTDNSEKLVQTTQQQQQKPTKEALPEFTFEINNLVQTPFGEGKVFRSSITMNMTASLTNSNNDKVVNTTTATKVSLDSGVCGRKTPDSFASINSNSNNNEITQQTTLGIFITSWTLANNQHPRLYCTEESAFQWQTLNQEEGTNSKTSGIFSVFGSFLSQSMKRIGMMDSYKSITQEVPSEILVPGFDRYYKDGAAVTTPFGWGEVRSFRESDGVYEVALIKWKMISGFCPTIYLMKDALSYRVSNGCHEGYPVLTSLGVSGNLASVQPTTGVHIVTVPMAGMVCYLQPKDILRPLKAAVTEDVLTMYGEGKVEKYRLEDDMYQIALASGSTLFAKAEAIERTRDGLEDQGEMGMKWLLRFLFFRSSADENPSQRSRSNSIASVSVMSQSSRSKI